MIEKAKAAVLASFAADSLALSVHWIYNTNVIDKKLGRVETLLKPEIASFHKGKEKGDFTHYGDQMLVLLESVSAMSGFDLNDFSERWQSLFTDYSGYLDQATKATLGNFASGKDPDEAGSDSTDLGGASRIGPLLLTFTEDIDRLVAAARSQTAMTHNNPEVLDSSEFFAKVACNVLKGLSPLSAIKQITGTYGQNDPILGMVEDGLASRDVNTRKAIAEFGQMCKTEAALPATLHLIAKYEGNLKEALVENIMAGGDSSARGMLTGIILGAYHGMDAIPEDWVKGLRQYETIVKRISKF